MNHKKELLWSLWKMQLLTKRVLMAPSKHWCVAGGHRLPKGTLSRMKDLWGLLGPLVKVSGNWSSLIAAVWVQSATSQQHGKQGKM